MRVFEGVQDLREAVGSEVGVSEWVLVDQERIDAFADATGDSQWIHVDPQRAADGPFGSTIAHGYLTLALLVPLMNSVYRVDNKRMGINYGLNRVRFPSPVPVDSRVRARVSLSDFVDVPPDGVQLTWDVVVEREGSERPACAAACVHRLFF